MCGWTKSCWIPPWGNICYAALLFISFIALGFFLILKEQFTPNMNVIPCACTRVAPNQFAWFCSFFFFIKLHTNHVCQALLHFYCSSSAFFLCSIEEKLECWNIITACVWSTQSNVENNILFVSGWTYLQDKLCCPARPTGARQAWWQWWVRNDYLSDTWKMHVWAGMQNN